MHTLTYIRTHMHTYIHTYIQNGFLQLDGQKMSKSTGNFLTLRNAVDLYSADAVRRMHVCMYACMYVFMYVCMYVK